MAPNASQPVRPPEYVITLVHGTFARGALWSREGSRLREVLSCDLNNVLFESFLWGGGNSHEARLEAGLELGIFLRDRRKEHPAAIHLVIAHSHGGNVALYALRERCDAIPIDGLLCLATPFLDCAHRKLENTFAILKFALPYFAGAATFAIGGGLIILITHRIPEAQGGFFLLMFGALYMVGACIGVAQKTYHFATVRLPEWSKKKADAIYRRLKLPTLPGMPVFVATLPIDEAALWLSTVQGISALPYRLWQAPSAVARRILDSWRLLLFVMGALILACVVIQDVWNIPAEKFSLAVFMIIAYSFLAVIQASLLMIVMMALVPKCFRSSPLVFGWEALFDNLLVDLSANPLPPDNGAVTDFPISKVPSRRRRLFRHSAVYVNEDVLRGMVNWIKQHITRRPKIGGAEEIRR